MLRRAGHYLRRDTLLFLERFAVARQWFSVRYMVVDPRTMGIYRLVIGALLCGDCLRHWYYAQTYYSNDGVLSNHYHLFRPSSSYNFSLFHAFSSIEEVHVAFALSLVCYFMFAIGWRTRLFAVLSCLWVTSMDNRLVMVENGGYVVVNLSIFWAMFLPLGQRFSVDALIRSYRERRERRVDALDKRWEPAWHTAPYHSLVSFIIVLNFAIIYIFNAVNKYGATWRDGLTLHYVLHIDRMVTGIAVWVREHIPFWLGVGVTHMVLVMEAVIVMCILWPRHRRWTRPAAMALIAALHTGFGVMMRLGPFSWFMIGWSTILIHRSNWDSLERWYQEKVGTLEVRFDPRSGTAFQLCRLLSRLDGCERLRFVASREDEPWLSVRDEAGHDEAGHDDAASAPVTGRRALWLAIGRLPAGRWLAPLARLLSLGLADLAALLIDTRHPAVGRAFGLQPARTTGPAHVLDDAPPSPWTQRLAKWRVRLRETVLLYLLLCATSQLINENKSVPKPLRHKQPNFVKATLQYPRIFQGWGMFAPNPIRNDGIIAVDALTVDGRHIDPFTGKEPDLNLSDARGAGLGQIPQDYANRIRLDRNKTFRKPLKDYLQRWHEITGRPEDELVWFNMYWLRDKNPEPGSLQPTEHEKICILSWRRRGYRPTGKGPKSVPKRCAVKSAGK